MRENAGLFASTPLSRLVLAVDGAPWPRPGDHQARHRQRRGDGPGRQQGPAAAVMLSTRRNPLWVLLAGGAFGALGLL
jgi:hypothetical protein